MSGQAVPQLPSDPDVLVWQKSSLSNVTNCVEIARGQDLVLVRDTKDRDGPMLKFTLAEWNAFLEGVRNGEFDIS
jgi:hypothetical protein